MQRNQAYAGRSKSPPTQSGMSFRGVRPYARRTVLIDATTGEVLDERTERLAGRPYQIRRHMSARVGLTREANDLLLAGLLVTVMGLLLWALAMTPGAV